MHTAGAGCPSGYLTAAGSVRWQAASGADHVLETGPDPFNDNSGNTFRLPPVESACFFFSAFEMRESSPWFKFSQCSETREAGHRNRGLFKCGVKQSHSGWIQHRLSLKRSLADFLTPSDKTSVSRSRPLSKAAYNYQVVYPKENLRTQFGPSSVE